MHALTDEVEISRAYQLALLLTRSAEGAMCAVEQAIEHGSHEDLLRSTVAVAANWVGPVDPVCKELPHVIRRVMSLPRMQRHCYVLRILEGMSAGECASLLNLEPHDVNSIAGTAAVALAEPAKGRDLKVRHIKSVA